MLRFRRSFRSLILFCLLAACEVEIDRVPPVDAGGDLEGDVQADVQPDAWKPPPCFFVPECGQFGTGNGQGTGLVYPVIDCVTPEGVSQTVPCGLKCVICNMNWVNRECRPNFTPREDVICMHDCSRCRTPDEWVQSGGRL